MNPDKGTLRVYELTITAKRDPGMCGLCAFLDQLTFTLLNTHSVHVERERVAWKSR